VDYLSSQYEIRVLNLRLPLGYSSIGLPCALIVWFAWVQNVLSMDQVYKLGFEFIQIKSLE